MTYIILFLAPIVFVFCIWKVLPLSLLIILPRPNSRFHKDPDALISKRKKQLIKEITEKIEALGFIRLGIKVEKPPLWAKAVKELTLASIKEQTFASIFIRKNEVIYYYYTPFIDGRAVLTSSGAFTAITANGLLQSAIASTAPEDILAVHQKQVGVFCSKGSQPYQDYTQDSRIKATNQYYNIPQVRKRMRLYGLAALVIVIIGCYPFVDLVIRFLSES